MSIRMLVVGACAVSCLAAWSAVSSMAATSVQWQADGSVFRGGLTSVPRGSGGELTSSSADFEADETVFAARFSTTCTLPPGTEVELWPIAADGASPDSSFGRNLWITSEKTGELVTFDLTRIVLAWEAGILPNNGVMLVIAGEVTSNGAAAQYGTTWGRSALTLNRLPAADNPIDGSLVRRGKRPSRTGGGNRVEDGSGKQ